ncbi:hypothetical protein U1Q18_014332, partial [Sarracenia purpurea var. burkii]
KGDGGIRPKVLSIRGACRRTSALALSTGKASRRDIVVLQLSPEPPDPKCDRKSNLR